MFKVTVRAAEKVNYFIRIIICDKLYICKHLHFGRMFFVPPVEMIAYKGVSWECKIGKHYFCYLLY